MGICGMPWPRRYQVRKVLRDGRAIAGAWGLRRRCPFQKGLWGKRAIEATSAMPRLCQALPQRYQVQQDLRDRRAIEATRALYPPFLARGGCKGIAATPATPGRPPR